LAEPKQEHSEILKQTETDAAHAWRSVASAEQKHQHPYLTSENLNPANVRGKARKGYVRT
jgi:hypothetical protein